VVAAVVARSLLDRLEHEHGVGLMVGAKARQVGEGGVGAEPVVGVVRADLGRPRRNHEALAGELLGDRTTAPCGMLRDVVERGEVLFGGSPVGAHEALEGLRRRPLGSVVHAVLEGLGGRLLGLGV
jgi:hypothetical protein